MDQFVPADSEDYYVLLGVSPLASFHDIKEAYRKQALKYHPDKNRDSNTTEHFQKLGRAWETLRDSQRRRDYDSTFAGRRKEQIDREARAQWQNCFRRQASDLEVARIEKARRWRSQIRKEYLSRSRTWQEFRDRQMVAIEHYEVLVRRYEKQLDDQTKETEGTMLEKFKAAISLSEASGQQLENHAEVVSKLMEARRIYLLNLKLCGQATRGRLSHLLEELENGRRSYEDEEFRHRQVYAQQAQEILDPEGSGTPLFCILDRTRRSTNYWRALARVRSAPCPFNVRDITESPWHGEGRWIRVTGEHPCGRCSKSAFHVIPDCSAARCPTCGMIVCNQCHRDLELLREFDTWLRLEQDFHTSLFSLEFVEDDASFGTGLNRCRV